MLRGCKLLIRPTDRPPLDDEDEFYAQARRKLHHFFCALTTAFLAAVCHVHLSRGVSWEPCAACSTAPGTFKVFSCSFGQWHRIWWAWQCCDMAARRPSALWWTFMTAQVCGSHEKKPGIQLYATSLLMLLQPAGLQDIGRVHMRQLDTLNLDASQQCAVTLQAPMTRSASC